MKFILSFVLFTLSTFNANTVFSQSDERQLIEENFQRQIEAWNRGDIESYCNAYVQSDSTTIISEQGVVSGYENILSLYKKYWKPENMGKLSFSDIEMNRLSNQYFFVTGHFTVELPENRVHDGFFSVVMKKVDNRWLILTDHSS